MAKASHSTQRGNTSYSTGTQLKGNVKPSTFITVVLHPLTSSFCYKGRRGEAQKKGREARVSTIGKLYSATVVKIMHMMDKSRKLTEFI